MATDNSIVYADGIVPLTDTNINYLGRWVDLENGSKQCSFESFIEISFTGKTFGAMSREGDWFYMQIDNGEVFGKSLSSNKYTMLAQNLEDGEHTIKLFAGAQAHRPVITGFKIDEGAKTLPINSVKTIEFIGDSIMEGYCTNEDKDPDISNNSVLNSFGYKTGQKLNQKHQLGFNIIAFGGIAMGKGSTSGTSDWLSMPQRYFKEREFLKDIDKNTVDCLKTEDWDTTKYTPDYIVIHLGTNDGRSDSAVFKAAYLQFIGKLQECYNGVTIFVMTPFNGTKAEEIRDVVKATNDKKVILIDSSLWDIPGGSDNLHPAPASHDKAAEKLYEVIDAYLTKGETPPQPTPDRTPETATTPTPNGSKPMEEDKMHWGYFVPMGAAVLIAATTVTTVIIKKKKQ